MLNKQKEKYTHTQKKLVKNEKYDFKAKISSKLKRKRKKW